MTVSIIIAVKTWQKNLEECVDRCIQLDYPDFEILIMPDNPIRDFSDNRIRVIPTGAVGPAQKRDMAIKHAKGEVLGFIDDDAYPRTDWLKNGMRNFMESDIAAVGGPAITAPVDSIAQTGSGTTYSMALVSGGYSYRYVQKSRREVDDYSTCNLLVRKSILEQLGGFNTDFWPGEDTKLCLDISKRLAKKIIYDPEVLVWHHRRPLFIPHLKQVANYALHRGYFVKRFPETSLRVSYFIPSIFLVSLLGAGIMSLFSISFRKIYFVGLLVYIVLVCIFTLLEILFKQKRKEWKLILSVIMGVIFTHITYGFFFIKGLLSKRLKEEK